MKCYLFTKKQWKRRMAGEPSCCTVTHMMVVALGALDRGHIVFRHEDGIPNPWWGRRLYKNGNYGKLKVI